MSATEFIRLKKANCTNCYKCIRHCPVKAIRFSGGQAHIIPDACIYCGECFVTCPQNAKWIYSEVERVKQFLKNDEEVYVSMAPSFAAYFHAGIQAMQISMHLLGFAGCEETAEGAQMVKTEYEQLLEEGDRDVLISSCCHSVNLLIQKYYPDLMEYLAPVVSPMYAHCKRLKEAHPGCKTVFIGPCISKKDEAERYPEAVDAVLTFNELQDWLNEKNVEIPQEFDVCETSHTRLFPEAGGILKTMCKENADYVYLSVDGTQQCMDYLENIRKGKIHHCFIEMSACKGSCIGGPLMEMRNEKLLERNLLIERYAGKKDYTVEQPEEKDMLKTFENLHYSSIVPKEEQIHQILLKMGKKIPAEELNCGACGYDSCRAKAIAVYQGKAEITMCFPYLRKQAETMTDIITDHSLNAILVLNESMEVQRINPVAKKLFHIHHEADILGESVTKILDPELFVEVLSGKENIYEKMQYLSAYHIYVETTVSYDTTSHLLICMMKDVTEEVKEREKRVEVIARTAEVADHIVEKQMRIVQEIASLLGETTAETKIALTKLKESISDE